jgi:hypothetical protein
MFASLLQRFSAWLCLTLALFSGLAPAQGYVLCLEADGCLSLEVSNATDSCGGCEPHRSDSSPGASACADVDTACPCVDISVSVGAKDKRVQPRPTDVPLPKLPVFRPATLCDRLLTDSLARHAPDVAAPRPAHSLLLIRSVELLL